MSFGVFNVVGGAPHRSQLVEATVSSNQPAPETFSDPLYVVPKWNAPRAVVWTITDWFACNGTALPQQGTDCLVLISDYRRMSVVWWDGTYVAPLLPANNLSDLQSRTTALANLGFQYGTGSLTAGSTASTINGTLTFPTAFTTAPTVLITPSVQFGAAVISSVQSITNSSCIVWLTSTVNTFSSGSHYSFQWLAIE